MDLNKLNEIMNDISKQPILKEIKVNSKYLPQLLSNMQVTPRKLTSTFELSGFIARFDGVPITIDDDIETWEPVYK